MLRIGKRVKAFSGEKKKLNQRLEVVLPLFRLHLLLNQQWFIQHTMQVLPRYRLHFS